MSSPRTCWLVAASLACSISTARADGMHKNGLSKESFAQNALLTNPAPLGYLIHSRLDATLFDDADFRTQMADPAAQAVMTEIVRCAAKSPHSYSFINPEDQQLLTFKGELGICEDPSHPEVTWLNKACRELVTGCVAARVNGMHREVPISIRGEAPVPAPRASLPTTTNYRAPVSGDPGIGWWIPSFVSGFQACTGGYKCTWTAGSAGTCPIGQPVTLTPVSPTHCGAKVRVCNGIDGCVDPEQGEADLDGAMVSDRVVGSSASACNGVTFMCDTGTFSTMFKMPSPSTMLLPPAMQSAQASYPAPETALFAMQEAGFYGDMFDAGDPPDPPDDPTDPPPPNTTVQQICTYVPVTRELAPAAGEGLTCVPNPACASGACGAPATVPYAHFYACYAESNELSSHYVDGRVCGTTEGNCFPHTPVRCHYDDPADNAAMGAHCTLTDGNFNSCQDPSGANPYAYKTITTYLNDGAGDFVNRELAPPIVPRPQPGSVETAAPEADSVSDGGCSVGATRGGLVTLVLAMIAIALARRSRR